MDSFKNLTIVKKETITKNTLAVTDKSCTLSNQKLCKETVLPLDPERIVLSSSQRRRLRKKKSLQKKNLNSTQNPLKNNDFTITELADTTLQSDLKESNLADISGNQIKRESSIKDKPILKLVENCKQSKENQTSSKILNTQQITISKKQDLLKLLNNCEESPAMASKTNKNKKVDVLGSDETDFVSNIKFDKGPNNKGLPDSDKSREEIKAEREAKKLAKQLAKTKLKSEPDVPSNKTSEPVEKSIELPKTANVPKIEQKKTIKNMPPQTVEIIEGITQKQEKSKAEIKAERRAVQEAQRAAKEQLQTPKNSAAPNQKKKPDSSIATLKTPTVLHKIDGKDKKIQSPRKFDSKLVASQHKVKLFNHLYPEREATSSVPFIPLNSGDIHPAIIRLGVQYASRIVMGSNARCIALLNALKQVVEDYTIPSNVEFSRGFEAHLAPCISFLNSCRPPAVSMNNALKHIKWQLTQLPNNIEENDAKSKLQIAIDTYIDDQIRKAGEAITIAVNNKISNGDVILTYGCSSLVENILKTAAKTKCFKVVVIEAHPWNEGKEMLRRLTAKNIKCSLVMISALSFVMREINKVVLGAGALLANGYVMARAGTAQVAMVAHAHNVPVLVCCEIHKFSERVQTDSFVYNEIGDPDDLIKCDPLHQDSPLSNWRSFKNLTPLNLTYDVTPPDLVTAVVTEVAILPCTSVPVILRIKPSEF